MFADCLPSLTYRNRKGRPTGAKLALKPTHVWGIRVRLEVATERETWRCST
jgi:hypothetical protein